MKRLTILITHVTHWLTVICCLRINLDSHVTPIYFQATSSVTIRKLMYHHNIYRQLNTTYHHRRYGPRPKAARSANTTSRFVCFNILRPDCCGSSCQITKYQDRIKKESGYLETRTGIFWPVSLRSTHCGTPSQP